MTLAQSVYRLSVADIDRSARLGRLRTTISEQRSSPAIWS